MAIDQLLDDKPDQLSPMQWFRRVFYSAINEPFVATNVYVVMERVRGDWDTEWTDFPICPECGFKDQDWWDALADTKNDGDSWKVYCPNCETLYSCTICEETTFTTHPVNEE